MIKLNDLNVLLYDIAYMIDLNILERKVDSLLEKETPRSLKRWFVQHGNRNKGVRVIRRYFARLQSLQTRKVCNTK